MLEIVIANDDGVDSPGILAAVESAMTFGNVSVIAPSTQKTGFGRSLIGGPSEGIRTKELQAGGKSISAFHIECSPALAVRFAFSTVFKDRKFDLAISGINYGENMGADITTSGTLGAAFEFASLGIPAMAVSRQTDFRFHHRYGDMDWHIPKHFLSKFIALFKDKGSFRNFDLLKIDVPENATETTQWCVSRLLPAPYYWSHIPGGNSESRIGDFRLRLNEERIKAETGTDGYTLLVEKKVSVTPLVLDFTSTAYGDFFE